MKGKNKGFLSDLDDTLFATSDFVPIATKEAVKQMIEYGLPAEFDDAIARLDEIRKIDSNAGYHFDVLCASYGIRSEKDKKRIVTAGVVAYHNTKFALLKTREGVIGALDYLKNNDFKLGIISYGKKEKQLEKLIRLNVIDYFLVRDEKGKVIDDFIFISEKNKKDKLFEQAIDKMNLDVNKTIIIDDRLDGIFAAKCNKIKHTIKLRHGKYKGQSAHSILLEKGISYKRLLNPDKETMRLIDAYSPKYEIKSWNEVIEIAKQIY